ncbi:hypothetical protein PPO43_02030 [Saprospira sp. CCB-QB6]|uniref:hypothetical protein n=1 Tax=Saprospira sp. CCB-QB6 TaxID=3023936 RepID=UPI00234B212C|nr:hypothetical protein [Saprospira sp. CCB-QB6]WCL81876.1 hypothetical protein PPO43_02030 [Saprospira sp. CCB-QB6]
MMSLQQKMQDYKLTKKMLKAFYGISYPTLRKRLRAAGLEHFIGRRKFLFAEFLLIFKALGQPTAILEELAELALIYEQLISLGLLKGQSQKDLPQKQLDQQPTIKLMAIKRPVDLLNHFLSNYYQVLLKGWDLLYGPTEKKYFKQIA